MFAPQTIFRNLPATTSYFFLRMKNVSTGKATLALPSSPCSMHAQTWGSDEPNSTTLLQTNCELQELKFRCERHPRGLYTGSLQCRAEASVAPATDAAGSIVKMTETLPMPSRHTEMRPAEGDLR